MKLLKYTFAAILALVICTPSFALSLKLTHTRDYNKIILTEQEKQEIRDTIDRTVATRNQKAEEYQKFHKNVLQCHDRKVRQKEITKAAVLTVLFPQSLGMFFSDCWNHEAAETFVPSFASKNEKRLEDYDYVKRLYLQGKTEPIRMLQAQNKLINSLTKLMIGDPAYALDIVAERKDLFFAMMENDPKVIKMLRLYERVITVDLENYSDFAIKKLANTNAEVYFERLEQYAYNVEKVQVARDLNKNITKKELIREVRNYQYPSKANRVMIKEIKQQDKLNKQIEAALPGFGPITE